MPNPLTDKYQAAYERVRSGTAGLVVAAWDDLDDYRDAGTFVDEVVPLVEASQASTVALTDAYLGIAADEAPLGLTLAAIAPRLRGVDLTEVYERPLRTVWWGLSEGRDLNVAIAAGRARAEAMASTDVMLAMRATSSLAGRALDAIERFVRVTNGGACELCAAGDGAIYEDGGDMEVHPGCGCTLEPVVKDSTTFDAEGRSIPLDETDTVVHDHGELGPVLAVRGEHFHEGDEDDGG